MGHRKAHKQNLKVGEVPSKLLYKHGEQKYVEFSALGHDPRNLIFKVVDT